MYVGTYVHTCIYIHMNIHTYVRIYRCGCIQWNLSIEDTLGPPLYVPITEVSSIQRSFCTLQCYTVTQNVVLNIEVFPNSEVCNREVPLYMYINTHTYLHKYICVFVCMVWLFHQPETIWFKWLRSLFCSSEIIRELNSVNWTNYIL